MGTGTDMNFYPQVWVRVQISTRSLFVDGRVVALPDLNPTRCYPYFRGRLVEHSTPPPPQREHYDW
jgi:hypothetical protein